MCKLSFSACKLNICARSPTVFLFLFFLLFTTPPCTSLFAMSGRCKRFVECRKRFWETEPKYGLLLLWSTLTIYPRNSDPRIGRILYYIILLLLFVRWFLEKASCSATTTPPVFLSRFFYNSPFCAPSFGGPLFSRKITQIYSKKISACRRYTL